MNAGQMLVTMTLGAPPSVTVQGPATAPSVPSAEQDTTVFAGVLRGVSPHEPARPAGTAKNVQAEAQPVEGKVGGPVQPETQPDTMATLLAMLEVKEKTAGPEEKEDLDALKAAGAQVNPDVQLPQNVVLSAAVPQMGAAQQVNGRMPESKQKVAGNGNERQPVVRVDAQQQTSSIVPQVTTPVQVPEIPLSTEKVQEAVAAAAAKTTELVTVAARQKAEEKAVTVEKPLTAGLKTEQKTGLVSGTVQDRTSSAASAVQQSVSTIEVPQNASPGTTVNEKPATATERIAVPLARMAVPAAQTTVNADVPAVTAGNVTIPDPQAEPAGSRAVSVTPQPVSTSAEVHIVAGAEALQKVTAESVTVSVKGVSAATPAVEPSTAEVLPGVAEKTVAVAPVRSNLDAYFQTSVRPAAVPAADSSVPAAQTAERQPVKDAPNVVQPVVNAVQHQVSGEIRPQNDLAAAQDQPALRQGSTEGAAAKAVVSAGNAVTGTAGESAATASGDDSGTGFGSQGMNGQAHLAMSRPVTLDNAVPAVAASAAPARDSLRSGLEEQVVSQVKEHLAGREIKPGVEQVVIRLSPDNLGELKLNLRMENQCLKVEIVTESSMVRDTLMKHADALKESLARQNITMETFDVSTGSNRQGTASQGQGDWRELARQRQYNAWAPSGGYKLGDMPDVPQRPQYQASSAHSMVDVHY